MWLCNVQIEYSTYQFSEELKGDGIYQYPPPPLRVLKVSKKNVVLRGLKGV